MIRMTISRTIDDGNGLRIIAGILKIPLWIVGILALNMFYYGYQEAQQLPAGDEARMDKLMFPGFYVFVVWIVLFFARMWCDEKARRLSEYQHSKLKMQQELDAEEGEGND